MIVVVVEDGEAEDDHIICGVEVEETAVESFQEELERVFMKLKLDSPNGYTDEDVIGELSRLGYTIRDDFTIVTVKT